jgi:hypothetical protein
MKSKKATITKQKGRKAADQPFILEFPGDIAKKKRYSTLRNACRAVLRHYKEWLLMDPNNREIVMTLPDDRKRKGYYEHSYKTGRIELYLQPLEDVKKK